MDVEIFDKFYTIHREKYYPNGDKGFIIMVNIEDYEEFLPWFKNAYEFKDFNTKVITTDGLIKKGKLCGCLLKEIAAEKVDYEEGVFKAEICFRKYIEVETQKPKQINIEIVGIEVPENKNLIRTEMEKGVLFTFEDKTQPIKKSSEDDYYSEYWEKERVKCAEDIVYFIEKYLTIFDCRAPHYKVPFILTENQKKVLRGEEEHSFNLIKTYRQSGLTSLYAAKSSHKLLFDKRIDIAYCGANSHQNTRFMELVRDFLRETPNRLYDYNFHYLKNNKNEILINNGNQIVTCRLESNCLIPQYLTKNATDIIVDDAEFNGLTLTKLNQIKFNNKTLKNITISSIKGPQGGYFTEFWEEGTHYCENRIELNWFDDERYNNNLKWHPIKYIENNIEKTAYIPGNDWYSSMSNALRDKIEYEVGVGYIPHITKPEDYNNKNIIAR